MVVKDHWDNYSAGAAEAGQLTPDRSQWRVSRSILIGRTNDEAWDHALNGTFGRTFEYLKALLIDSNLIQLFKHDPDMPDDAVTVESAIKHVCIVGGSDEVLQQLHELWDLTGGFGTLLMIAHDWDDKARWVRSMEMLAKEIVPALPTLEKV
jgi:alkanesulfonate monooxygenase SsuD/methylene tetrahydromethanopterin reductase-like flavin-dependent oxidoreductase (luciferase family)